MINDINEYQVQLDKLTRCFWDEYLAADVKRGWNKITAMQISSQNDVVRKYASRFQMLKTIAEMRGVAIQPGDRGETVTLEVAKDPNPFDEAGE